ncbi:MAG: leucyl aminopeptidase [Saccharospirillaceae bacterium]|nr:leucyl aminopeptidase [Pseudomonadales bacterium]NRB77875.1 leucyl aminopeptidase [Saccharospirillaceae bacterium]
MNIQLSKQLEPNLYTVITFAFDDDYQSAFEQTENKAQFIQLADQSRLDLSLASITPFYTEKSATIVVGCGKKDKFKEIQFKQVITAFINFVKTKEVCIQLDITTVLPANRDIAWGVEQATQLSLQALYEYNRTLSKSKTIIKLDTISFVGAKELEQSINEGKATAHGANITKELGNLPPNICTPTYLADQCQALADQYDNCTVEILEEAQMQKLGMGSLLSVSKGSIEKPKLIALQYKGNADEAPLALVGKGVTFDSGGISLKPGAMMDEMKYDMLGAGSVIGTFAAIAELQPKLNLVVVVAAVENMPAGNATKPGDVVTSMSGQTIEIFNTDAEGRMILADALTYTERFKPRAVIDVATLTGACIVALGHHPSAVYSNNDDLCAQIVEAGLQSWDRVWPMPLWDDYEAEVKSGYGDLRNTGTAGRAGGSITAAMFLKQFAGKFTWAHLDIAGSGWDSGKVAKATGRPVGLLTRWILNQLK